AMLSQIGCVTLPPELVERLDRGAGLTDAEHRLADRLPHIADEILATIPRLEGVRAILRHQQDRADRATPTAPIPFGARILRVAADFDTLDSQGVGVDE